MDMEMERDVDGDGDGIGGAAVPQMKWILDSFSAVSLHLRRL
jgi:hypothetical protein